MFNVCVVYHSMSLVSNCVCLDAPIVTIKASQTTVTEGRDSLLLECEVDANPPASIKWVKNLNLEDEEILGKQFSSVLYDQGSILNIFPSIRQWPNN